MNSCWCHIIFLQCLRTLARSLAPSRSISVFPENAAASSSKHFAQFFLGRLLDLNPCTGVQLSRYLGSLVSVILVTWPNQRKQFPMYVSTGFTLACLSTFVFLTRSNHLIFLSLVFSSSNPYGTPQSDVAPFWLCSKVQTSLPYYNNIVKTAAL